MSARLHPTHAPGPPAAHIFPGSFTSLRGSLVQTSGAAASLRGGS